MGRKFLVFILPFIVSSSCAKYDGFDIGNDLAPLENGMKVSSLIGYCAALAHYAFNDTLFPDHLVARQITRDETGCRGFFSILIDETHPIPWNRETGTITVAGQWDYDQGGVISVLFTELDIELESWHFYGIYTVPIIMEGGHNALRSVFAEQDIIVGDGADTILDIPLTSLQFDMELHRLDSEISNDPFAVTQQNAWFLDIDTQNSPGPYDDLYRIHGGGQMVSASHSSGGILYHALIGAELDYGRCPLNPLSGIGLLQNLKVGEGIELGTLVLEFHDNCDGTAFIQLATGKYFGLGGQYITFIDNP